MTLTATTDQRYSGALPASAPRAATQVAWAGARRVRVWDLPTRLFHWSLVLCTVALVATGYAGGAAIHWHARLGYTMLALLLFRVTWGFIGGRWSRFASFLYSPAKVLDYLRGRSEPASEAGHNPLGAFSVFAMLALLMVQVGTGLVSDDEISFTGPLSPFVTASQSLLATWFHKQVGQGAIITLVLLHVAAIFYYLIRRKNNLIKPMIHGDKAVPTSLPASRDDARSRMLAVAVFGVCAALAGWLARLG